MANVDLKKLNEFVQNGQSFEDVLKGIVEELRAKASPDVASSVDKKISKSNYSEAKASEGKNVQDKVMNESENVTQSKNNKANSNDTTVISNSDITTGNLKESIELLESTTEKIVDGRNDKANESGEKISTNQTGQLTVSTDRAKHVDSSNVKEAIKENVRKTAERQEPTKNVEEVPNPAKQTANNVVAKDSPSASSLVKQAQDGVENGIENDNLNDEKIGDAQVKLPKLNDEDKSSANQIAQRPDKSNESNKSIDSANSATEQLKRLPLKLPANDSSVTKSTNANANLNVDNKYSVDVAKSNMVIQDVKTTEPKGVEVVHKGIPAQQQDSANTTLLAAALKVLEDSKNVVSQNPKAIKEDKNVNTNQNNQNNQNNQQKQVFANAGNIVKTVDNMTLEKSTVQEKAEKVSNNQNTTQNDSSDTTKASTYVNAATKTAPSGIKSSNVKSDVVIIQNDSILKGVSYSNVQNENVQSSKGATVILNENGKGDVKPARRTVNDVVQVHISNDNEDINGKDAIAKVVYIARTPNANDSPNAVNNANKYNVQNIYDEVANDTNPKDGNQMLDLLSNFSKFTNERQVILLIPTLLGKVENSSNVSSNANGIMNMKGIAKKSDDSIGSSGVTVISNPILRVETKIGASAQKMVESVINGQNVHQDAVRNSDKDMSATTDQSLYLQQMQMKEAKKDIATSAVMNGNEDNRKLSTSNALIMSELVKNVKIPKQESDSSKGKSGEIIDRVVADRTKSSSYDNHKYADLYKNVRNSTDDASKNKLEIKSIQIEYIEKKDDSNSSNSKDTLEGKPNVSNKFAERLAELSYKTNGERPEIDSTISTGQSASSNRASDLDLAERLQNSRNLEEIYEKIRQFATSYKLEEKVQMKLFPEELGNLDVELKKEGKQIQILFLAENESVKDTIEKNSHILRERLASLDFEVRTFEVKVREEEKYYDQKQGQEEGKNQNSQNGRNSRNGRSYQEDEENNKNNNRKWVMKDDDEREFSV